MADGACAAILPRTGGKASSRFESGGRVPVPARMPSESGGSGMCRRL
ncbi:hypothetical protein M5Y59_08800 [Neisseria meningitidis]|nr:hypothetical protein [Neisseria meningitidis]MCL5727572.1 hypothetical protein [Neisseria meningitidis]MCL5729687.1 hypothetical protein [Neisseria meningitidis]